MTLPFSAAIFDMDGLLLDTERVCMSVFKQACESLDVPFLEDVYLSVIGCNAAGAEAGLRAGYDGLVDYQALNEAWRCRYDAVVNHQAIPIKEGVISLLEWMTLHQIPTAVATSTQRETAQRKLSLSGLDKYFTHVTTGCEVQQGKPHPEIYLLAATRLDVDPTSCLAFEDSNNGVRSAVSAGMMTYQIPDLVEPTPEVIALGHTVSRSLTDVLATLAN